MGQTGTTSERQALQFRSDRCLPSPEIAVRAQSDLVSPMPSASIFVTLILTLPLVSVQAGLVNFTNSVFLAPTSAQQTEVHELQLTVYPFSALRNTVDGTVKAFFEVCLALFLKCFANLVQRQAAVLSTV